MVRFLIRRILWLIPAFLFTSMLVFLVTSVIKGDSRNGEALFLNPQPKDVQTRTAVAFQQLQGGRDQSRTGSDDLLAMGGACLPFLLPRLDELPPESRGQLALVLKPLAIRMGVYEPDEFKSPERAALFWSHFWAERSLDFSESSVRRAVQRLVRHPAPEREEELVRLDTYALRELFASLKTTTQGSELFIVTSILSRITGEVRIVDENATPQMRTRAIGEWRDYWRRHRTEFVSLEGAERLTAIMTDTRYGRWIARIVAGELGVSESDGEPIMGKLLVTAPRTLLLSVVSLLLGLFVAVVAAWAHGRTRHTAVRDWAMLVLVTIAIAIPAFAWASGLHHRLAIPPWIAAVLGLTFVPLPRAYRMLREWIHTIEDGEVIKAARARGLSRVRAVLVHGGKMYAPSFMSLAISEWPKVFGFTLVCEVLLGLPGMGTLSLQAVRSKDTSWLIAIVLFAIGVMMVAHTIEEIFSFWIDPHAHERALRAVR